MSLLIKMWIALSTFYPENWAFLKVFQILSKHIGITPTYNIFKRDNIVLFWKKKYERQYEYNKYINNKFGVKFKKETILLYFEKNNWD